MIINGKTVKTVLCRHWAIVLTGLVFLIQAIIMYGCGENIYASTHDNLDLHVLDYHLLAENNLFFAKNGQLPKLGGISRNYFFSEWSAYSWLYMLLPTCYAYITGYLLKTVLGVFFSLLLAKYVLKEKYEKYKNLLWLASFAFGNLPFYSVFAFYFVSIPLVIYLLLRIYDTPKTGWYIALFFYPLISYFTFFGVFILGYLLLIAIVLSVWKKRLCGRLLLAVPILLAGYITMEYRLFDTMLFSGVETIRETMVMNDYSARQMLAEIGHTFTKGIFHAQACQTYFVLPICVVAFFVININYLLAGKLSDMRKEPLNGVLIFILANCFVYGVYGFEPVRTFLENMVPIITGLQLNRTVYFNPFLWYVALAMVLAKLWDAGWKKLSCAVALIAVIVVFATPERYNDFYHTCYNHLYERVMGKQSNNLDYGEYYSVELMEEIKEDIGYQGEKSVAYGLNPAVLEYSNIFTLDGCISYYEQSYKEEFRKLIAPALEMNEANRVYFDDWGARAYIYSGSEEDIYSENYDYAVEDKKLYMDMTQFRKMGGKYIFSRIDISNTEEKGLTHIGTYINEKSPYTIYVYCVR